MKRLRPTLLILLSLVARAASADAAVADAAVADEPIYRLDYPSRAPEFTDRPPQQSNRVVTLGAPSAFPALQAPRLDREPGLRTAGDPSAVAEASSEIALKPTLAILSPGPGEGIRANSGAVPLALALSPALGPEERLRLSLDRQMLMTSETPPAVLEGLARGEHTLLIERLDREGRALAKAERTFYVLRTALGRAP